MGRTLVIALVWLAVSALVVVLGVQNRGLREQRDQLTDRALYAYRGMYVPETPLTALDGSAQTLGTPSGRHQVVFFFNHTCPYCARSAEPVAAAARALHARDDAQVSVLGVCECTSEQARGFAERHGLDFPIVTLQDGRQLALYRARSVPVLLAINRDGRVTYAVQGVFGGGRQQDALFSAVGMGAPSAGTGTAERESKDKDKDDRRG